MSESRNIFCQILYKNSESDTQNCKEARIERNKVSTNNISIIHPKSIENTIIIECSACASIRLLTAVGQNMIKKRKVKPIVTVLKVAKGL